MSIFDKLKASISKSAKFFTDLFKSRKTKLNEAIKEGNATRVEKFLKEKDGPDILVRAVEKTDNIDVIKTIINKCKIDVNSTEFFRDKKYEEFNKYWNKFYGKNKTKIGFKSLFKSIESNNNKVAKYFIEESGLKIEEQDAQDLLLIASLFGNSEVVNNLVKNKLISFDSSIKSYNNSWTVGNYVAIFKDAKKYLKESSNFKSDKEIDDFIKFSKTKAMLLFSYANESAGSTDEVTKEIFDNIIKDYNFPEKEKITKFLELTFSKSEDVWQNISNKKNKEEKNILNLSNGNYIEVIKLPMIGHAVFGLVEYDKNKQPLKFSYCDGNSTVLAKSEDGKYGYGAVTFDIDKDKISKFLNKKSSYKKDFGDAIHNTFFSNPLAVYQDNAEVLFDIIADFSKCDDKGKPIIAEKSIPTKPQNRGNCSYKSRHNVMRELLRRTDETMIFEVDGKPAGKGYEIYKNYKKCLIDNQIENLLNLAEKGSFNENNKEDVLKTLQKVFLKSISKGKSDLIKKVKNVLLENNINLKEAKDSDGRDITFCAAKSKNIEIFQDFVDSGLIKKNARYDYDNKTILHKLVRSDNNKEIIQTILKNDCCDPKLTNLSNNTALHLAIKNKHIIEEKKEKTKCDEIIKILIENGGVTKIKNNDGYSVEELAIKYGFSEIAKSIAQKLQSEKSENNIERPKKSVSNPEINLQEQNKDNKKEMGA